MLNGGILDEVVIRGGKLAHNMANSVALTVTGIISPIINQAHAIYKEGLHEGPAYYPENRNYAVPYKLNSDWKLEPQSQMMGERLSWEDGRAVMNATVDVVSMGAPSFKIITPYKVLNKVPGSLVLPWIIKKSAVTGFKYGTGIK